MLKCVSCFSRPVTKVIAWPKYFNIVLKMFKLCYETENTTQIQSFHTCNNFPTVSVTQEYLEVMFVYAALSNIRGNSVNNGMWTVQSSDRYYEQ